MPDVRARQHDVLVDRRRSRWVDEVIDEYRMYPDQLVDMQADRFHTAPAYQGTSSRLAADLDESAFVGEDDELGAVACAELHHGPVDVGLHGEG